MAERATRDSEIAARARQWLLNTSNAVLCTRCADTDMIDWPFGSLAPFALTATGEPIVLISEIAEHTRNLVKDPRASLFVSDPDAAGDPQATWRLTIMGRARRVRAKSDERAVAGAADALVLDDDAFQAVHARYSARVPDAPRYFDAHRFGYWKLEPLRVRAIGGFGAIHWLEGDALLREPLGGGLEESAPAILEHMNEDHEAALLDVCAAAGNGERGQSARMLDVDRAGFLVETRSPDAVRFIEFGREIHAADARNVFVELTKRARESLATASHDSAGGDARVLDSGQLLGGAETVQIDHRGARYTLRITRNGRMILTK
jgi:putative heme iron utilization protein